MTRAAQGMHGRRDVQAQPGQASGALWLHNDVDTGSVADVLRRAASCAGTAARVRTGVADFGTKPIGVETPALVVMLRAAGRSRSCRARWC
jgi:hypothetical protein